MSVNQWRLAVRDSELGAGAKHVAHTLSTFSCGKNHCYPSKPTLVKATSLTKATLQKHIKALIKGGFISVCQNGGTETNVYTFIIGGSIIEGGQKLTPLVIEGGQKLGGLKNTIGGGQKLTPNKKERRKEEEGTEKQKAKTEKKEEVDGKITKATTASLAKLNSLTKDDVQKILSDLENERLQPLEYIDLTAALDLLVNFKQYYRELDGKTKHGTPISNYLNLYKKWLMKEEDYRRLHPDKQPKKEENNYARKQELPNPLYGQYG